MIIKYLKLLEKSCEVEVTNVDLVTLQRKGYDINSVISMRETHVGMTL